MISALLPALIPLVPAPTRVPPRCVGDLGARTYFGSAEQLRELKMRVRSKNTATCPRLGFKFRTPDRTSILIYDRATRSLVRVALWQGDAERRWEYWSGVTDASVLRDDPDDGFSVGVYHDGAGTESRVPEPTRRAVRQIIR